jgi:hypothetical protein
MSATDTAASRGNVLLFCGLGNHVDLRGLLGGAERIRTSDLRSVGARALDRATASGFSLHAFMPLSDKKKAKVAVRAYPEMSA